MATIAPYESTATAAFTAFGEWAGFMEKISPAIVEWIQAGIPLHQQRKMDRRIRVCKRECRTEHLTDYFIEGQVLVDFGDLSDIQRKDITELITFELHNNK